MSMRPSLQSVNVQRHRWRFDDVNEKDWLSGSGALSRWFDVYTLLVPDNEAFYIRTLAQCAECTTDDAQKTELLNFFRQESLHGLAHRAYWPKMRELGINYDRFLNVVNWLLYRFIEPMQPRRVRMSMVAAIEHVNASLANTVLKEDRLGSATRSIRELFYWHFVEEIEHKAVAHDALSRLYPGYFTRVLGALIAFPVFYFLSFVGMAYFLAKENRLLTMATLVDLYVFWIRNGALKDTVRHLVRYFGPSFDPWALDDLYLVSEVRNKLRSSLAEASVHSAAEVGEEEFRPQASRHPNS